METGQSRSWVPPPKDKSLFSGIIRSAMLFPAMSRATAVSVLERGVVTAVAGRNTTADRQHHSSQQQPPHHSTLCTWAAAFTFEQPPRKTKLVACSWHHDHSQQQEENGELRNISDACIYCIFCYLHIFLRGTLMRN